jgi:glycosyltransferase involved in cell wall biosynthesis
MKIAFVYDKVNKFGGAERVLLALHEIWPEAPLYTAVYDKEKAKWADVFQVKTSFLRYLPFLQDRHEILSLITPYAFESFNFDQYDVVLSVTSADAKGIITKPSTLHITYCLTPTRYFWSGYDEYLREPGVNVFNPIARLYMRLFFPKFRQWDFIASSRPDNYIAISYLVARRIKTYYRREAIVIYPPIDMKNFKPNNKKLNKEEYYLIVSRLVPYKRIDYAIRAFNRLGWKLKIIGSGIDEGRLKNLAYQNIKFLGGNLTDEKLCWYYQNCKALIFPGEEDFGLTAVEVQACGKPVIAFYGGGVKESVQPHITGQFYNCLTEDSLIECLYDFEERCYLPSACRKNAELFTKDKFQREMKLAVERLYKEHRKKL